MKENDGRGGTHRRKKCTHYTALLVVVVAGLFGIMFSISLTKSSLSADDNARRANEQYDKRLMMILRKHHHGLLNRQHHMRSSGQHGDAKEEEEIERLQPHQRRPMRSNKAQQQQPANTDKTDEDTDSLLLQGILEGHLHMINLRPLMKIRPITSERRRRMRDDAKIISSATTAAVGQQQEHESSSSLPSSSSSYRGMFMASFCHLDWSLHKNDPSTTPMFRWLVDKSPDCNSTYYEVDLYDIVKKVKQFDNTQFPNNKIKVLNLAGIVFHESRCGSTLIANMLATMNPTKHRVYSESSPPNVILRMTDDRGNLSLPFAANILQDVIYLMSRSNDFQEERVFFKMQPVATRSINVFQQAFPKTPWIFVYRDPVQVMMSHLGKYNNGSTGNPRQANCVQPQKYPAYAVERIVTKYSSSSSQQQATTPRARDLSYQDFCAAHLASITETALEHILNSTTIDINNNIPVNYDTLPDIMWTDILPNHWHVPTGPDEIERMQLTATQYSKQGKKGDSSRNADGGVEFTGDSQKKNEAASWAIRMAAQRYLQPSFDALEKMSAAASAQGVKMHS